MSFTQVDRERIFAPIARLWSLTYVGSPQTAEEIAALYGFNLEGAYEEHWVIEDESGAFSLTAPNPTMPPTRLDGEVHALDAGRYRRAIEFAEQRTRSVGAPSLCVWSRSDLSDRLAILSDMNYQVIQTAPTSSLLLGAFDATRFADRVAAMPYRIASINELIKEGLDWVPLLYASTSEMAEDVPDPHDHEPMPYAEYQTMIQNPVIYDYDLMFVAMDGNQVIGYTRVSPSRADPTLVNTGLSGVVRSHRRQGIVTALKVRAIEALRERGFKTLLTDNDVTNPMYQLNLDLGFVWQWDWVLYERKF